MNRSRIPNLFLFLFLATFLVLENHAVSLPSCQCPPSTILESLKISTINSCESKYFFCEPCHFPPSISSFSKHVVELNEVSLNQLLDRLRNKGAHKLSRNFLEGSNVAVLYYAEWCPFSKKLLPIFEMLSENHPDIVHVAVEEHNIRPSLMSRFGVSSVPVLFLHNSTHRMKYSGNRSLSAISHFYFNFTGQNNSARNWAAECSSAHAELFDIISQTNANGEHCPYAWAFHPELWFGKKPLLLMATSFLLIRLIISVARK